MNAARISPPFERRSRCGISGIRVIRDDGAARVSRMSCRENKTRSGLDSNRKSTQDTTHRVDVRSRCVLVARELSFERSFARGTASEINAEVHICGYGVSPGGNRHRRVMKTVVEEAGAGFPLGRISRRRCSARAILPAFTSRSRGAFRTVVPPSSASVLHLRRPHT